MFDEVAEKLAISKEELMSYHKLPKNTCIIRIMPGHLRLALDFINFWDWIKELENRKNISELCLYSKTKFY